MYWKLWLVDMDTDEGVETADKATTSTSTAPTNGKTEKEKAPTKETSPTDAGSSSDPVVNGAASSGSGTDSDKEQQQAPAPESNVGAHFTRAWSR